MAFYQATRNRLARFVSESRTILTEEFSRQLQLEYGIDPTSGEVTDLVRLDHLDDARRETAQILRDTLTYYLAGQARPTKKERQEAIERIIREQAFTILNRLSALRMMEARGLLLESVALGYQSKGFQLYSRLAGTALGETGDAYRSYLISLFDEFAVELPALFDRFSPEGRLFPRTAILLQLLEEINHPDIDPLWAEDETIGWIYQYFNSKEERKQMRDASSAPRNNRELAVRNQFFTPRYVVEFLTDNTLGRIWYEMTKGETRLLDECDYLVRRPNEVFLEPGEEVPDQETAEDLTQEELLQQTVYIPYRPLKDPREIKMLDPACGSMHFGLYAFDLFETIYEEAWDKDLLGQWAVAYADKAVYMRDVPRLIIEYNIHGIDIDTRAVQIAGLSLWLRAQRSWKTQGFNATERPTVSRSNVVVAEPMPGDEEALETFLATQFDDNMRDQIVADLMRRVFEAMRLAGEAGSLLKIEEEIAGDIATAKEKWAARPKVRQTSLFDETHQASLPLDTSHGSDEQFWEEVEDRVYTALQQFAIQATEGESYRRHLFVEDAARGFAFIDVCRHRYDVILMNPPFGLGSKRASKYLDNAYYGSGTTEVCASFYTRAVESLNPFGYFGAISSRTFNYLSSLSDWRNEIGFGLSTLLYWIDLGKDVLDEATNETAAYIVQKHTIRSIPGKFGMFHRVIDKPLKIAEFSEPFVPDSCFIREWADFQHLPDKPLCYWISKSFVKSLQDLEQLGKNVADVQMGLAPRNEFRFSRLWWEVEAMQIGEDWIRYAKGGELSAYYSDVELVLQSSGDLREIKANLDKKYPYLKGNLDWVLHPENSYFLPGLTFGQRTTFLRTSVLPAGCYFSVAGKGIFANSTDNASLMQLINTPTTQYLTYLRRERLDLDPQFQEGDVVRLPWPRSMIRPELSEMAIESYLAVRNVASFDETDSSFISNVQKEEHASVFKSAKATVRSNETNGDELFRAQLGLNNQDDRFISEEIMPRWQARTSSNWYVPHKVDRLQFALGCSLGRWDVRYATDQNEPPPVPDPFDPLPVCPQGISWSGILVNEVGHPEDIVGRVREALHVIWQGKADDIEVEACDLLAVDSLREHFGNPNRFFGNHLSRYSKSRRYAPIYWPLTTTNGSYTLWLYYHRLDAGTLYQCVNDFVDPKLETVKQQLNSLRNRQRDRVEERELERLSDLTFELEAFRSDLLDLARFWRPNLNDGVEITATPLYALFGNRKWRKRLEKTWGKMQEGEYDWAHLAMSIWPERVVPKCTEDRSLAIAHDLEDLFWVQDEGSWRLLGTPDEEIEGQITRRQTSQHDRLQYHLGALANGAGKGMPAYQVWQHLQEGDWDDTDVALSLWPERAGEKHWDNPFQTANLTVKMPTKRTKANRKRYLKRLLEEGSPELVDTVAEAFENEDDALDIVWQALVSGVRDEEALALALWPERVVNKCVAGVEMAQQHNLQRYFWYRLENGVWRRRKPKTQETREEIARRQAGVGG